MAPKLDIPAAEKLLLAARESKRVAAATEEAAAEKLMFAKSESKAVGLKGGLMDKLRDNSPRIVGGLKIAMDAALGWAGIEGVLGLGAAGVVPGAGFLIAYAAIAIVGRLVMMAWGTKANQKKAAEHTDEHGVAKTTLEKVKRPKDYPMESAAGISVVAETAGVGFGVAQLAATDWTKGYTSLLMGLVAVWSYANLLFGKEKGDKKPEEKEKQDALRFGKSESKAVGWFGRLKEKMKENPVLTSSLTNVALCIAAVLGGSLEGQSAWYVTAFVMGIVANGVQALLIKKREFNIEGALDEKEKSQSAGYAEKLQAERSRRDLGGEFSMAPA